MSPRTPGEAASPLSERQAAVLRAVVASYVGDGAPVGSKTVSLVLPMALSPASIRNTLTELAELGFVDKPHHSAGRVPTELGLRVFVDSLVAPADVPAPERRDIAYSLDAAQVEGVVSLASELLSRHTRQLGFVVAPRLQSLVLRHVSLVRLSSERLLVVLVSETGDAHRRVLSDEQGLDQAQLDGIATLLSERVAGRTLAEVRARLVREAAALRREANRVLERAVALGLRAVPDDGEPAGLVIATRLALLDQPEFSDPRRLRELLEAVEVQERMLHVLDQMLDSEGVAVAFGAELDDPALRRCALVATRYGALPDREALGVLGVLGPARMDFARVIPLVDYLSEVVTGKLRA